MPIPTLPFSRDKLPVWPEAKTDEEAAPIARGVVFGLLLSVPLWIVLIFAVWRLLG